MSIALPPYPAVGRCIYCPATRHSPLREKLGDEHIIPEGLGGTDVLPEASCGKCEGMTCSIETYCQKPMFGALRYQLNLPSKRPKDRPTTLPVRLLINGEWRTQQVPIADYPLVLFTPILPLPGILDGPDRPQGGGPLRHFHKDMSSGEKRLELLQRYGATHIASQSQSRIDKFGRMLAKIAHSYAVASYGLGNFRPLLINTIRGTEHDPTQLVGGSTYKPRPANKLHVLKIGWNRHAGKDLLIVRLNLFANLGLPVYFCVAGER